MQAATGLPAVIQVIPMPSIIPSRVVAVSCHIALLVRDSHALLVQVKQHWCCPMMLAEVGNWHLTALFGADVGSILLDGKVLRQRCAHGSSGRACSHLVPAEATTAFLEAAEQSVSPVMARAMLPRHAINRNSEGNMGAISSRHIPAAASSRCRIVMHAEGMGA